MNSIGKSISDDHVRELCVELVRISQNNEFLASKNDRHSNSISQNFKVNSGISEITKLALLKVLGTIIDSR